ncbi:MAG: tRNA (N6-threonylcarbamoyladenosine(37)-N6)-methyltransferase TrmO [Candidatus Aenigmarchaeota archaeon]|nr:tRNA (N6-threonylcarbamoyladenosine(37)-N6)-methyltransferase TrmO [Candidatus Aenigmarchaeota archaeon]
MKLKPIGVIHSPYKSLSEAPFQGKGISRIEIFQDYLEGLKDIETFSHLHVFYWMDKSEGFSLSVKTPWDPDSHGLFSTRTPNRPNPIGYSVAMLVRREGNVLVVEGLDAIEGTPVIDIKPYVPKIDRKGANSGWLSGKFETRYDEKDGLRSD